MDIELDNEAKLLVETVQREHPGLLVIFSPDGSLSVNPSLVGLSETVDVQVPANLPFYDLVLLGAGPAGLGAAAYAVSEGIRTAMIQKEATGGYDGTSSRIENYLGSPNGISGADLAQRANVQARLFGAEILTGLEATKVRVEGPVRVVTLSDGSEINCHTLIIATGVSIKELDVPGVSPALACTTARPLPRLPIIGASMSSSLEVPIQPARPRCSSLATPPE